MARGQSLTMLIYPEDKEFIRKSTLNYPNIETGGDLFGLWQNESEVVVQFVSGPGKHCRRTPTAFFQDKTYLSQVGGYLTTAKGLCNIGEWHSHHRLNLPEPSSGDRATVWRNMPGCGLKRFLLIIATITPTGQVNINGFMFTAPANGNSYGGMDRVQTRVLTGPNPFRSHPEVLARLQEGSEMSDLIAPSQYIPTALDENDETPRFKRKKSKKFKISKPNKQDKQNKAKKKVSQPTEKSKKSTKKFRRLFWKKKGSYTVLPDDSQSDPMPATEVSTRSSNNIDDHYNYVQTTPQPVPTQQRSGSNQPPYSPANHSNAERHRTYKVTYEMTSNV